MPKPSKHLPIPSEIKEWVKIVPVITPEDSGLVWKKTRCNRAIKDSVVGFKKKCTHVNREEWYMTFKNKTYIVSRVVFYLHTGLDPQEKTVDHIDRNPLNNNVDNLRLLTLKDQQQNRKIKSNNKTGIRGVSWSKNNNKWRVEIGVNGKCKYLGLFTCKIKAAEQYNEYAKLVKTVDINTILNSIEEIQCDCIECTRIKNPPQRRGAFPN